ncbi:DUF2388 domain-containing protein [Pseudomonas cedrina]|uniref:DUF2388 domain-containing protein n=1 Tax=Pseudomonas cedrina TaxID=651740 RepID=UPI0027837EEA|nr:DUF2388 domain-containing protein [Pseudomonas cedrina]MDQ0650864.1 uncharacterized protein (TIGR02448 family) [Pseudomonas cedrina]
MAFSPLLPALVLFAFPLFANAASEGMGKVDQATLMTLAGPVLTSFATLGTTSHPLEMIKSAKGDALAFIGSDGDIRGAQFEWAVRTYHDAFPARHMSDMQLAKAIAVAY